MKKRVLIIEDDAEMRAVYAEVLKEAGYEVAETIDEDWDILLLDSMTTKKAVRKKLATKPFIVLSHEARDLVIDGGYGLEPSGYVDNLNSSPGEVVEMVNRILGQNK